MKVDSVINRGSVENIDSLDSYDALTGQVVMSYYCQDVDKISLTLGLAFVLQSYLQSHNDSKVEPT